MFLDSVGIILKKNSQSHYKITILDKIQGKIECFAPQSSLSLGALMTYNIQQKGSTNFIVNSSLIYIPLTLAKDDILFFHHVLELTYYFTQIGNNIKEIFDLFEFLYKTSTTTITHQFKKLFLLKLLTNMGVTPEHDAIRTSFISELSSIKIEELNKIIINTIHEKELDRWLWYCLWQHPYVNEFKTIHFLSKNRTL